MRHKILIADDDHDFVETLQKRLESVGYDTVCAYEGIRTVEMAHKELPDLIILDWKMPTGEGDEVLKDLKTRNDTRHIPVMVLTGHDETAIREEAMRCGASAFMLKPYDPKILLQKIHEILEFKALEESLEK